LRVEVDLRNEKIGYKVREHSLAKVPVMIVLGKREVEERAVNIRRLGSKDQASMGLEAAIEALKQESLPPDERRKTFGRHGRGGITTSPFLLRDSHMSRAMLSGLGAAMLAPEHVILRRAAGERGPSTHRRVLRLLGGPASRAMTNGGGSRLHIMAQRRCVNVVALSGGGERRKRAIEHPAKLCYIATDMGGRCVL
jgi:hypothetical protein